MEGENKMKDECIFCKIANGVIPSNTLYEDEDFRVILDINPATKGHALILPKKHYNGIYDLEPEIAEKVFCLAQKMAKAIKAELNCDGLNILQNNGETAGQTIFHFHMHVIPRYVHDNLNFCLEEKQKVEYDLGETAKKIKSAIKE